MTSTTLHRSRLSPNLARWRGGDGPELVLIHGVGLTADAWYAMLPQLVEHFSVTAIDLPGHGESEPLGTANLPTLSDYSTEIAKVLDQASGPVFVVGHSLGALIALDLAVRHPQNVSAVAPLNAVFRRTSAASAAVKKRAGELALGGATDSSATLERWFGASPNPEYLTARDACEKMLDAAKPAGYAAAYKVFADCDGPTDDEVRTIAAPLLCLTGSDEPNSTPAMSQAMAGLAPNGQAVVIDGARHMMPMTHANEVNELLIKFAEDKGLLDAQF